MPAAVIDRFNTSGSVDEFPKPALEPGTVLARVTFAGLNPMDWKIRDGGAGEHPLPMILGQDFAGVVEETADDVTRVSPGMRVFGITRERGSYAEYTLVPEHRQDSPFALIPAGLEDATAAALPTPGLTVLACLALLGVERDTTLLIIGAGGAVGSIALQLAHLRGARVTAVVRPGQSAQARAFGADEAVEVEHEVLGAVRAVHSQPFAACSI